MQSITSVHKKITYNYHYVEEHSTIVIFKDNKLSYTILVTVRNGKPVKLFCSCPGNKYHGYCHHKATATKFKFDKRVKPRTFIDKMNEEFIAIWLENRKLYERG